MSFRPLLALVLALCLTLVTACSGGAKAVVDVKIVGQLFGRLEQA